MNRAVEDRLKERIDHVEAAYEFMLAYAAQGVTGEEEGGSATEIRTQLKRTDEALEGLAALAEELVATKNLKPAQPYRSFIGVLERDAASAQAAIQLALAQRAISSQLIDNLNALIHLRSLLTDLFFIDEILKLQQTAQQ
jgi:thioredoxin-like negative regulator of GroEL